VNKSKTSDCHFGTLCSCKPAVLIHRWIDDFKEKKRRPSQVIPSRGMKGVSTVMRERRVASSLHARQVSFSSDAEVHAKAQRELAAFYEAVFEMYGPEEAMRAALDWIEELARADQPVGGGDPNWRQTTIAAAGGLASRVLNNPTNRRPADC
jgi:hypothetical protein